MQAKVKVHTRGFCLITGCPRSGTTAVTEWLARDRHIARFNESRTTIAANVAVKEINRLLALKESKKELLGLLRKSIIKHYAYHKFIFNRLVLDKEPLEPVAFPDESYQDYIDNLRAIFADARILFMLRDPLETIWSMVNRQWGYSLTSLELHTMPLEDCVRTWNKCGQVILANAHLPNTYVCHFNQLVRQPQEESQKIGRFLEIGSLSPFNPRPYSKEKFPEEERRYILDETCDTVNRLRSAGLLVCHCPS
jgi:hypothetical protein